MPVARMKRSSAERKTQYSARLPIALEAIGNDGFKVALARVAVDTGELKGTLTQVPPRVQGLRGAVQIKAGTDHARPVEYGTERMAAQPYLRPALRAMVRQAGSQIIRTVLKEGP